MKLIIYSSILLCLNLFSVSIFPNERSGTCTYARYGKIKGNKKMQPVYKIFRAIEWNEFNEHLSFSGSQDDQRDGFIHLATKSQVENIIKKYFVNERPLYIAKFSKVDFLERLKWEESSSGELYPHLYDSPLLLYQMEGYQVIH